MLIETLIKKVLASRELIKRVELSPKMWNRMCEKIFHEKLGGYGSLEYVKKWPKKYIGQVPVELNTEIKSHRIVMKG